MNTSIVKDDVRYNTLSEEWNEYVLDDGARVRLKLTVTRIAKTDKYNREGEPILIVETGGMAQIRPPKP